MVRKNICRFKQRPLWFIKTKRRRVSMQEAFSGTAVPAEKSIRLLIVTFATGLKTPICSDCRSESAEDRTALIARVQVRHRDSRLCF